MAAGQSKCSKHSLGMVVSVGIAVVGAVKVCGQGLPCATAGWSKSCRGGSFLSTEAQRPRWERVLSQLEYEPVRCLASTCLPKHSSALATALVE